MTPSFAKIEKILSEANWADLPEFNITILRNIMIEPIEPYLRYYAYQMGQKAKIQFGEYDCIYPEAIGPTTKLINPKIDCVLIFMKLETLSWRLACAFPSLSQQDIQSEEKRIHGIILNVLEGIRIKSDAMILWHSFESPIYPNYGIWDSQINTGQLGTIDNLNDFLRHSITKTTNAYYVNMNVCLSKIGSKQFYDLRYWHIGQAPYSREALEEVAFEDFKFIRPLKGKNKKCLVLDCDNTLWGGIVGEDGLSEIQLEKNYPGSAYYEFQQEILNLYHRGIILALCSKNNEDDVWEVFHHHPNMLLKEEHIATAQINWEDKAKNIQQIALDLNIGLDSVVFIDDNEFEINLIRETLPEVEVIHLTDPITYRDVLASCGLFDTLTVSKEDKQRGSMYKTETLRKKLQVEAKDLKSYYQSLEMVLSVCFADEFSTPRIAQQTQKTNQFNLTTRRYSDADIQSFIKRTNWDVIFIKLSDYLGDSGIIGTCILKYFENTAFIDTFLLSCRALGRNVEDAFIIQTLKLAKKRGCQTAIGEYYATKKNRQVEFFYAKQGFLEIKGGTSKADQVFQFDLTQQLRQEPSFFKEIQSEI